MSTASLDRREFARLLALGTVAAPLAACPFKSNELAAQPPAEAQKPPAAPAEAPPETEPDAPPSPADLLLQFVQQCYPDKRLDERVLTQIRGDIEADLMRSRVLSAFPLRNADEPGHVFRAFRGDRR